MNRNIMLVGGLLLLVWASLAWATGPDFSDTNYAKVVAKTGNMVFTGKSFVEVQIDDGTIKYCLVGPGFAAMGPIEAEGNYAIFRDPNILRRPAFKALSLADQNRVCGGTEGYNPVYISLSDGDIHKPKSLWNTVRAKAKK